MTNEHDLEISNAQAAIHKNAVEHGWWEPQEIQVFLPDDEVNAPVKVNAQRTFGDLIALVHSETSEALEAYRHHGIQDWYECNIHGDVTYSSSCEDDCSYRKPEGAFVELADAIIRILDMSEFYGVDMEALILEKMKYNEGREYRHGNKIL